MLQLYDIKHNKIELLTQCKDAYIENEISDGLLDKNLSFSYPLTDSKSQLIKFDGFIRTKDDEFVIKEISFNDNSKEVKCKLNVEELEEKKHSSFNLSGNINKILDTLLNGIVWTYEIKQVPSITNAVFQVDSETTAFDLCKSITEQFEVEFKFDTINKKILVYNKIGVDSGQIITSDIQVQGDTYDLITEINATGANGITCKVTNHSYSPRIKSLNWTDERYTSIETLRNAAQTKLDKLCKPLFSYSCSTLRCKSISVGDYVNILDKKSGTKVKERAVKTKEYIRESEKYKNEFEIDNAKPTFQDYLNSKFNSYDSKFNSYDSKYNSKFNNYDNKINNLDNRVTNLEKGSGGATLDESIYIIDTTLLDSTDKTFALKSKYGTTIITDWGDGTTNNSLTHTYAQEGTYTIKTNSPYTPNTSSTYGNVWRACLIEIVKLNEVIENCTSSFYDFKNLKKVGDILGVTIANSMFKQCTSLVYPANLGEKIKDCRDMYAGCTSLLDTGSYRESMEQTDFMFDGCSKLQYTGYMSDSITSAERMFRDCVQLVRIDYLSNKLENAEGMFKGCTGLVAKGKNIVLPDSIKNASNMFCDCSSLNANIYWPSSLENASGMFYNCTNMENFRDLINLTNLTNMEDMFRNCTSATFSNVTKCPINVTNLKAAFYGCTKLQLPTEFFSNLVATAINASWCFQNCSNLSNRIDIPTNITKVYFMFAYSGALETTRTVSSEINYDSMYSYCTNLTTISDAMYELMQDTTYIHGLNCFAGCINIVNPDTYANLSSIGSVCSSWF
ncbi:phage tail protein [Clostridium sp. HCP1S3_B4]|uniref:phage tail protein n=4 Tax=unclassified Clostridium TaxID=2614128 RepID=UPI003F889A77